MRETATINDTYRKLNSIRLGLQPIKNNKLLPGIVFVKVQENKTTDKPQSNEQKEDEQTEDILECNYNAINGVLSGLSKLYRLNYFDKKTTVNYEIVSTNEIVLHVSDSVISNKKPPKKSEEKNVFMKQSLRHIHIEPFRPENLKNWIPRTESDIYMLYGVLEEYTNYKYCCGTNSVLLQELGYSFKEGTSKPDAILIDKATNGYLVAEFKVKSSAFSSNHHKDDIDVLVFWEDDSLTPEDKDKLPKILVNLSDIAKTVAIESLSE